MHVVNAGLSRKQCVIRIAAALLHGVNPLRIVNVGAEVCRNGCSRFGREQPSNLMAFDPFSY